MASEKQIRAMHRDRLPPEFAGAGAVSRIILNFSREIPAQF
jgi:hypothetical protein